MKRVMGISEKATNRNIKRLLIIRLSAMGDVAMTVPVLSALTHQYPDLQITVLTKPFFAPIFAQLNNVSVYEADVKGRHEGVFGLYALYKELSAQKVDAVADLHNVLRSKVLKRYFKFGGIPFFQVDKGRAEKKTLTKTKNKVFEPLKTMHERYADVLAALGFSVNLSASTPLVKERLSEETLKLLGNSTKKYVGIAPFAAFAGKKYPFHLMEEVIGQLDNAKKYNVLLFGGGAEEEQKLEFLASRFASCINVAGKISFPEELSLISNLDVMLSMDSGNGHLAAMYGIPVVTLWGVTHPYAGFAPFGQDANNVLLADREKYPLIPTSIYGNKIPEGYEKAMETISPKYVVAKLIGILDNG